MVLRDFCYSPELFPNIESQSLLWCPNIIEIDPYFLFPFISAFFSYKSIKFTMKMGTPQNLPLLVKKFRKFMPIFPFIGMAFISTFPAGLSINWTAIAI